MRKLMGLIMALMIIGLVCTGVTAEGKIMGGWQAAADPAVTEELKKK